MKDPTIYDVPTPAEVEEMERLPSICTCRGNNDCDGSCQCPKPSHYPSIPPLKQERK